jgi:protein phosphatase
MIVSYGLTDVGRRRSLNEDTIFIGENLLIVCDGMGGHKAGEVASQLAVEVIDRFIGRSGEDAEITWPYGFEVGSSLEGNRLRTAVKLANRTIARKAASSDDYSGMGTTATVVLVAQNRPYLTFANVGDSRIYLIRRGDIVQLSRDDSWANLPWGNEGPDAGVAVALQHVLTKALGAQDDVDFEVNRQELVPGDVLLLCSDGLTNMLSDQRLLEIVQETGDDLERGCRQLISEANEQGGRDNISAILARYQA